MNPLDQSPKFHKKEGVLPDFFRPIMWSYDFSKIDAKKDKKMIVINTINYGDLRHWKWLKDSYGLREIQKIVGGVRATELRPPALKLASILFLIKDLRYAPRGAK